jgi:hypothetical protein
MADEYREHFSNNKKYAEHLGREVNSLYTDNCIWIQDIGAANRNNTLLNENLMAAIDAIKETNRQNWLLEQQLWVMQHTVKQLQLDLHAARTNPMVQAQFTALPQVPPPAAPGMPLQVPNPVYAALAQATFAQAAQAAPALFAAAPLALAPIQECALQMPCILDPLKFSGEKKDHTLDQWLQSMGLWFAYYQIFDNNMKIGMAIMYLEKGAANYMHSYTDTVAQGQPVGTWQAFVQHLETAYCNLAPEKDAQNKLATLCATKQASMAGFTEKFWQYVPFLATQTLNSSAASATSILWVLSRSWFTSLGEQEHHCAHSFFPYKRPRHHGPLCYSQEGRTHERQAGQVAQEQDDTIVSMYGNAAELRQSSVLLVHAMIGYP